MSSFKMSTGMPHDVAASPGKESAQTHECLAHLPWSITDNDTVKLTYTGVLSVSSSWCSVSSSSANLASRPSSSGGSRPGRLVVRLSG